MNMIQCLDVEQERLVQVGEFPKPLFAGEEIRVLIHDRMIPIGGDEIKEPGVEEKTIVKHVESMFEGIKLSSWILDEDEFATLGGKPVEFFDPGKIKVESGVKAMEPETMSWLVAVQELRKSVGGRLGVFGYLFYLRRGKGYPFVAISVEDSEKDVEIAKLPVRFRLFRTSDFGQTDGFCKYEGGEGLVYPPELWESNESFRRRMEQFPEGCMACVNDKDEVIGYMFCHPWKKDSVVPLNCMDLEIPKDADCFYAHDIAVLKDHRGKGIGKAFLGMAISLARKHGFDEIKGVAVLDSHTYWEKHGFEVGEEIDYGPVKGRVIRLALTSP